MALKPQGDVAGALAEYREAIRRQTVDPGSHIEYADTLLAGGGRSAVASAYRQALTVLPRIPDQSDVRRRITLQLQQLTP